MGTPRCGICNCNPGRRGRNCQCSTTEGSDLFDIDDSACQAPNSTAICSGRYQNWKNKIMQTLTELWFDHILLWLLITEEFAFVGNVNVIEERKEIKYGHKYFLITTCS